MKSKVPSASAFRSRRTWRPSSRCKRASFVAQDDDRRTEVVIRNAVTRIEGDADAERPVDDRDDRPEQPCRRHHCDRRRRGQGVGARRQEGPDPHRVSADWAQFACLVRRARPRLPPRFVAGRAPLLGTLGERLKIASTRRRVVAISQAHLGRSFAVSSHRLRISACARWPPASPGPWARRRPARQPSPRTCSGGAPWRARPLNSAWPARSRYLAAWLLERIPAVGARGSRRRGPPRSAIEASS